jgi:hypothetical protein
MKRFIATIALLLLIGSPLAAAADTEEKGLSSSRDAKTMSVTPNGDTLD